MNECCVCLKPKSTLHCAACAESVCKKCAQFLSEDQFELWDDRPELLKQSVFCYGCYTEKIEPSVRAYEAQVQSAKNLSVFFDTQGKETRLLSRKESPVKVENMTDREATLLKLAFKAVLAGYNGIIDVSINSVKVRQGGYQTSIFSGEGIPTQLPDGKLAKS